MRAMILSAVLLLALAAPANAKLERLTLLDIDDGGPVDVDLDGDSVAEKLLKDRRADGFTEDPFLRLPCGDKRIGPGDERVVVATVHVTATTDRHMLLVQGSSGATGRVQRTRAHYLDPPTSPGQCPVLRTVFRFPHKSNRMPRPPRGTAPGSFSARVFERGGRIWFRTFEGLYRRSDAGCCPSFTRRITWRPKGGGYVRAKTRVRRLS